MRLIAAIFAMCLAPMSLHAAGLFDVEWREIAKGVWVGNRADALRYPVLANTVIVVGDKGVLVFDGGGFDTQGAQTIAEVRKLTNKPVTHIVVSHWHGDHHRGIAPIVAAFPNAAIVAQRFTCAAMFDGPEKRVEDGESKLDETYAAVADWARTGVFYDGSKLSEAEKAYFSQMVADYPEYKIQLAKMKLLKPTTVVDDKLEIELGGRKAELIHFGKGNTAGDLTLWLPLEKILASGDIVVAPFPYGFGSYPVAWSKTLGEIAEMRPAVLVPGHGPVMHDLGYVQHLQRFLDAVAEQARAAQSATADPPPSLDFSAFDPYFSGGDPAQARLFDMFFKQPIKKAAMNEATGHSEVNEPLDASAEELCPVGK